MFGLNSNLGSLKIKRHYIGSTTVGDSAKTINGSNSNFVIATLSSGSTVTTFGMLTPLHNELDLAYQDMTTNLKVVRISRSTISSGYRYTITNRQNASGWDVFLYDFIVE